MLARFRECWKVWQLVPSSHTPKLHLQDTQWEYVQDLLFRSQCNGNIANQSLLANFLSPPCQFFALRGTPVPQFPSGHGHFCFERISSRQLILLTTKISEKYVYNYFGHNSCKVLVTNFYGYSLQLLTTNAALQANSFYSCTSCVLDV